MNLSQISFQYKRLFMSIMLVLMAYGAMSYFWLPAQEDPHITIREAVVTTLYPGMPAARVEMLITKTIEEAIRRVPEVEKIKSVSFSGRSIIHIEIYDRFFELEQIWDDVRAEINKVMNQLPEGTNPPVLDDNFGDVAVLTVALLADPGYPMGEILDTAQHIRDMIYSIPGTKKVDIIGLQQERIYIAASNAKLAQLGISPKELTSMLQNENIIRPGGSVDVGGTEFIITPTGNFDSLSEVKNALIPLPNNEESIALQDIAEVTRGVIDPPDRTAYFNGHPAVIFAIAMSERSNVLDFTPKVTALLDNIQDHLPAGYQLEIATRQADQVRQAVTGVTMNVIQTLVIVLAVVILFLGVRTGLIVGTIVPAVMLVTLAIMNFANMALERMSLATLVISLGLLVDNGIVIAEDFKRRLEEGEDRLSALKNTGGTLAIPLLTSSLTTILVFMPLMLAEHVAGEYTRSISLIVMVTLLASWAISLTITPTLCYWFIKTDTQAQASAPLLTKLLNFDHLNVMYEKILRVILHARLLFVAAMVGIFMLSLIGLSAVPAKFFPDSDRAQVLVYLDLPAGTSMRKTDATLQDIFEVIQKKELFPHVENFTGYAGFGGPRFVLSLTPIDPEQSKGFVVLNIDDLENVDQTILDLRGMFSEKFPGVMARVTKMFLGPSDSSTIEIQIKGPDADYIYSVAEKLEDILRAVPGAIDVKHDWENRVTQYIIEVDQQRAKRAGVTSADVARSLQSYFSGNQISEFREGDDIFPIVVRAADRERFDPSRVHTVNVYAQNRNMNVPLDQIANVKLVNTYSKIARENMFRTITVQAKNTLMTAESMVPLIDGQLNELRANLPPNHLIEYDGVIADSRDAQGALRANLPVCIGIILILLVAQFNSFKRTSIIVLTIPLLLIGATIGLHALNTEFGFMAMLGIYALAGIIINNAIVLIDRIEFDRTQISNQYEAMITACVRRLRPIIMTTVTTILGLLPLIMGKDPLFYSMAGVIAFGLAIGTILTLAVTPVLYSLLFRIPPQRDAQPETHMS